MHGTALKFTAQNGTALHWLRHCTDQGTALHYVALHCSVLHWASLHFTSLHLTTALHWDVMFFPTHHDVLLVSFRASPHTFNINLIIDPEKFFKTTFFVWPTAYYDYSFTPFDRFDAYFWLPLPISRSQLPSSEAPAVKNLWKAGISVLLPFGPQRA